MQIKLYNSLTRQTEAFSPLTENLVRLYSCGPTVYNYAHIGNMRAFVFADLLQRVLRTVGNHELRWVMNITNIDDKTIRDSAIGSEAWRNEMGKQSGDPIDNLNKLTEFYLNEFLEDIKKLGLKQDHFHSMPKATEYIEQMQDLIRKIVEKGYGYVSGGSVYFDVAKWSKDDKYGKLFKIDFENFRSGVRIDADQYDREQVSDFVLWKAKKEGEPAWPFEINGENCEGRPGWHIECSAMEHDLLGLPFDIHTGGIDLKFPHHEDEIAQSKAGYGVEPTAFWCHNEFLEVEGEKMSKSAGNFFTLRDLLQKGLDPLDIRFAMMSAHYNSKYNFTFEGVEAARKARTRVQEFIYALFDDEAGSQEIDAGKVEESVFAELANDLHTPRALGNLFSFINKTNPRELNKSSKEQLINFFRKLNDIFDIWKFEKKQEEKLDVPSEIDEMAQKRLEAKKSKNFALADELRDKITQAGYNIKDTKDGYELTKA